MKNIILTILLFFSLNQNNVASTPTLAEAIVGEHRSVINIARNAHRHPQETLEFFDIKNDMTVLEIWPGSGGWYTEILAPFLNNHGTYYAANYDGSSGQEYFKRGAEKFVSKLKEFPKVYGKVLVTTLMPPTHVLPAPDSSVDLILTFRNVHNWVNNNIDGQMFKSAFIMLKKGGVLGVVAHRTRDENQGRASAKTGYLSEKNVITIVESVGFRLEAESEINANPADTATHPKGVWTLPPMLRLGDVDRKKYEAIGESDRMTLKFVKP